MRIEAPIEITAVLLALELQLMDPVFRNDRSKVSELLASEFQEFGSSGRVWSREEILAALEDETDWLPPNVTDFTVQSVGSEAALATYTTKPKNPSSSHSVQATLRSSLWVRRQGRWQILFHQGTRVPGEAT